MGLNCKSYFQVDKPVIAEDPCYIRREKEKNLDLSGPDFGLGPRKLRIIYTLSPWRTGKTSMLFQLENQLNDWNWHCCYIDFQNLIRLEEQRFYECISDDLANACQTITPTGNMDRVNFKDFLFECVGLMNSDTHKKVALLFDNVELLVDEDYSDTFFGIIRSLNALETNIGGQILIALAGSKPAYSLVKRQILSPFNVAEKIDLLDFNVEETEKLTRMLSKVGSECNIDVDEQIHALIYQLTSGHPYLTQRLCSIIETYMRESKAKAVTPEMVEDWVNQDLLSNTSPDVFLNKITSTIREQIPSMNDCIQSMRNGETDLIHTIQKDSIWQLGIFKFADEGHIEFRNLIFKKALGAEENILYRHHVPEEKSDLITILHLSDLHLSTDQHQGNLFFTQLSYDLKRDLKIEQINYLVLSGDITNSSNKEEYEVAANLIQNIVNEFVVEKDCKRLILAPGNHDINWDLSERAYEFVWNRNRDRDIPQDNLIEVGEIGILERKDRPYNDRIANFCDFYKRVKQQEYPLNREDQGIIDVFPDDKIIYLSLNSCSDIDHFYRKRARIDTRALTKGLDQLMNVKEYDNWLKIAVWHHPIAGREMMADVDFLQLLAVAGFRICMHGHIHQAIEGYYRYDVHRGIHILGAGTFGSPTHELVTGVPLQYNLMQIDSKAKEVTTHTRKKLAPNGAWAADAIWGSRNDPKPYYQFQYD